MSNAPPTKPGKPGKTADAGVHGLVVGVRLSPAALAALDAWIALRAHAASRPEAIRSLIEQGMRAWETESEVQATAHKQAKCGVQMGNRMEKWYSR